MEYKLLDEKNAYSLRDMFVKKYIDNTTEYYHNYIEPPSRFEEGDYYHGYLWDSLKDNAGYKHLCSMDTALAFLKGKNQVFLMWDLFSNQRVFDGREFSLNLPKNTVICLQGEQLAKQLDLEWDCDAKRLLFPEDVYCFDEQMNWSVILTHEYSHEDDSNRICFLYDS